MEHQSNCDLTEETRFLALKGKTLDVLGEYWMSSVNKWCNRSADDSPLMRMHNSPEGFLPATYVIALRHGHFAGDNFKQPPNTINLDSWNPSISQVYERLKCQELYKTAIFIGEVGTSKLQMWSGPPQIQKKVCTYSPVWDTNVRHSFWFERFRYARPWVVRPCETEK